MGRMQFLGNFDGKKENYCIFFYRIWLERLFLKECYDNEKMKKKNKKRNPYDRVG